MTRLADIQGHIASMDTLLDIVGAMRSLAGMRMQEAHERLPGIRRYAESMAAAIDTAFLLIPQRSAAVRKGRGGRALVLCTAEQGFVGGFNERLAEAAEGVLEPSDLLFVLGSRGAALLHERGTKVHWTRPMATRLSSVQEPINPLTAELYAGIAAGTIASIEVMFSCSRPGGAASIERHLLLPIDPASINTPPRRQPPLHYLVAELLVEKLIAEYVFALLTKAAVESIASENAARFAAMESARDNVGKKLEQLRQSAQQARQEEITTELLDLATGVSLQAAPALSG